jgi:hypothetical protein
VRRQIAKAASGVVRYVVSYPLECPRTGHRSPFYLVWPERLVGQVAGVVNNPLIDALMTVDDPWQFHMGIHPTVLPNLKPCPS